MEFIELKHRSGIPIRIRPEKIEAIKPDVMWCDGEMIVMSTVVLHSETIFTEHHPNDIYKLIFSKEN